MPPAEPVAAPKIRYDCAKCPGYCCTYERIAVEERDITRLAKHFGLEKEEARRKFTKIAYGERVLRHRKDHIFKTACQFLDPDTRRCTVYTARPAVCREYPDKPRCGYFEFLSWERRHQEDDEFIPLSRER